MCPGNAALQMFVSENQLARFDNKWLLGDGVFVKGSVDIIWIGQVKCGDNIIKKHNTLEKGKYSRNICLWAEMKHEKMCIFWERYEKMEKWLSIQIGSVSSKQCPRLGQENSRAVQAPRAWREGRLGVVAEEESLVLSLTPWVWAASPVLRARGMSQCAAHTSAIKPSSTFCGEGDVMSWKGSQRNCLLGAQLFPWTKPLLPTEGCADHILGLAPQLSPTGMPGTGRGSGRPWGWGHPSNAASRAQPAPSRGQMGRAKRLSGFTCWPNPTANGLWWTAHLFLEKPSSEFLWSAVPKLLLLFSFFIF